MQQIDRPHTPLMELNTPQGQSVLVTSVTAHGSGVVLARSVAALGQATLNSLKSNCTRQATAYDQTLPTDHDYRESNCIVRQHANRIRWPFRTLTTQHTQP